MFAGPSQTPIIDAMQIKEEVEDDTFQFDASVPGDKVFIKVEPDLPPLASDDESSENVGFTHDGITAEGSETQSVACKSEIALNKAVDDGIFVSTDAEMTCDQIQNNTSTTVPLDAEKFCLVKNAAGDVPYRIMPLTKPNQALFQPNQAPFQPNQASFQPIAMIQPDVPYAQCKLCNFRSTDADRLAAHELSHSVRKKLRRPKRAHLNEDGTVKVNRQKDIWNHDMTLLLLRLVKSSMHSFKYLSTRNLAFANICKEFADRGHDLLSHAEMKKKWSNLLTTYRRIRARKHGKRGLHTNWPYYLLVDELVGKQNQSGLEVDVLDYPAGENDPTVGYSRDLYQFVGDKSTTASDDEAALVRIRENKNHSLENKLAALTRQINADAAALQRTPESLELQYKLDTMKDGLKEMSDGLSEINDNLKVIAGGLERFMSKRK